MKRRLSEEDKLTIVTALVIVVVAVAWGWRVWAAILAGEIP